MTEEQITAYNFMHQCLAEYIKIMEQNSTVAAIALADLGNKSLDVIRSGLEAKAPVTALQVLEAESAPKAPKTPKARKSKEDIAV